MLKKRIIASLLLKDGLVVQSIDFHKYLPIGKPAIAVEFLNRWGIDEIAVIDITATKNNREPNYKLIEELSTKCYVPLAVGGGITKTEQIQKLLNAGADKIIINHSFLTNPNLVTEASQVYGNQCVIVSVDILKMPDGSYKVYDYSTKQIIDTPFLEVVKRAEDLQAGEILINAVHKDGSYTGYDIELMQQIGVLSNIPIIAMGGAKNAYDFTKIFAETTVSAAAAGNFFHFTEHSVNTTKAIVHREKTNYEIRLDTHANYAENVFDENLRLAKKADEVLENLLFIKIEKEII
jgi:cyclase